MHAAVGYHPENSGGGRDVVRVRHSRGMWWVAWHQHRWTVTATLAAVALIAGALVAFRMVLAARLHAAGCSLTDPASCSGRGSTIWWDAGGLRQWWDILHGAVLAAPIVLGVFAAAPLFPREFEQRTHVLALTQSVGRIRWWAAKVTVAGAPLVVALVGLGLLAQWVDESFWVTGPSPLANINFGVRSIIPAAFGLLSVAIAVTAGIVVRATVPAIVASLLAAGLAVMVLLVPVRPHLVPVTRDVTPIADAAGRTGIAVYSGTPNPNDWYLGSGYLDATGHELAIDVNPCYATWNNAHPDFTGDDPVLEKQFAASMVECMHRQGAASQYTDYLPASMTWPLRGAVAGICVVLAALLLAAGARWLGTGGQRSAARRSR